MRACQALALDEERTTFHPQLWDETGGTCADAMRTARSGQSGASSRTNASARSGSPACIPMSAAVIPTTALAYIPFVWMITEAQRCGLQVQVGLRRAADPDHDRRSRHVQERDFEARQGRTALRSAQGSWRLLPLRAAQAGAALLSGDSKAGRRRGRGRARQDSRKRLQAHRQPRARLCAGRPSAVLRRRQGGRRDRHAGQFRIRDHASNARQAQRATRRSTSGTRSGNAASSISRPSARRCGWWCFRCSAARSAPTSLPARSAGYRTSSASSADSCRTSRRPGSTATRGRRSRSSCFVVGARRAVHAVGDAKSRRASSNLHGRDLAKDAGGAVGLARQLHLPACAAIGFTSPSTRA